MNRRLLVVAWVLGIVLGNYSVQAQGIFLRSVGSVNQSMGGASVAAPLDSIGSQYWNPATTAALETELAIGVELTTPTIRTRSFVPGVGGGSQEGEPGTQALPSIGFLYRQEDSPMTLGLGVFAIAGFRTTYASSTTNPLFLPQPNAPATPGGFGSVSTATAFMQVAPTITYALSEQLSIGGGPTLTLGELSSDPLVFAAPDDADGSGVPRYPEGRGTRFHWGGGAQVGIYYITERDWHFGFSIKSPQWMETFRFHTQDELGNPRVARVKLDLPMMTSIGVAYSGIDGITLATDVRYIDYKNADGFGGSGFNPDGSLRGLGLSNILALATGIQYRVREGLYLRGGYTYNQSTMQQAETTLAVSAPLHPQHTVSAGGSWQLSDNVWVNFAYTYWPHASISGPLVTPAGPIPGATVTTEGSLHRGSIGLTVKH